MPPSFARVAISAIATVRRLCFIRDHWARPAQARGGLRCVMKIVTFSFMRRRRRWSWPLAMALGFLGAAPASAQLTLVNMVPASRSGEINQDSEPSLTINRRHPKQLAASAFTWDNLQGPPMIGANAPIYVTVDEGDSWDVAYSVPSTVGAFFPTGDITLWFSEQPSGSTSLLYTSILHSAEFSMRVFRADDYRLSVPMTLLDTQTFGGTNRVDQPRVRAETVHRGPDRGKDRVYVGFNNGYREFGSPVNPLNKSTRSIFRSTPRRQRPSSTSVRSRPGPRRGRTDSRSSRRSITAESYTRRSSAGEPGRAARPSPTSSSCATITGGRAPAPSPRWSIRATAS